MSGLKVHVAVCVFLLDMKAVALVIFGSFTSMVQVNCDVKGVAHIVVSP